MPESISRPTITLAFALLAVSLTALMPAPAAAQNTRIEVGVLNCSVAGGAGFIFGSTKRLSCTFQGPAGADYYTGTISKFGIDIGATQQGVLSWGVFAPTTDLGRGALSGGYGGVTGEATVGVGLGANVMLGGSGRSIALQPLSVQAQQGLNLAAGIAAMELRASGGPVQ